MFSAFQNYKRDIYRFGISNNLSWEHIEIIKNSVVNLNDLFIDLENLFMRDEKGEFLAVCNVVLNVRLFEYKGSPDFSQEHMYELFAPDTGVEGVPEKIMWNMCLQELENLLIHPSFKGEMHTHMDRVDEPSPELGKWRIKALLEEVRKYIEVPPERVYKYKLGKNSEMFRLFLPWHFCYVFLSDGKGMVLNAYADI